MALTNFDTALEQQHCAPSASVPRLSRTDASTILDNLPLWTLNTHDSISREFTFRNYYHTMAFVNAVAFVAHQQDHHPDMHISYKSCRVTYWTHVAGGLSINDFICAAKLDALVAEAPDAAGQSAS